jgi:hypothetical protein
MSHFSKPKKVVPKGTVRELKLVQTVSRRGRDTIKAEEVKTPAGGSQKAGTSRPSHSPSKRNKMEVFDEEPVPWLLGDSDISKKRQTLVYLLFHHED